jgi:hypothetical protein
MSEKKTKRKRSPVSEGTLVSNVLESGVNFLDENLSDDSLLDIPSSSSEEVDNTDEDPDYDPSGKVGLASNRFAFLSTIRPIERNITSDSDNDDPPVQNRTNPPEKENQQGCYLSNFEDNPDDPEEPMPISRPTPIDRPGTSTGGSTIISGTENNRARPKTGRPRKQNTKTIRSTVLNPNSKTKSKKKPESPESSDWEELESDNDPDYEHNFRYSELPGPKHCPPQNSNPIEYFNLFFTINLISTLVTETNRYAEQFFRNNPAARNRMNWVQVSLQEMKAFIAIVLNMGIIRKPSIRSYWYTSSSQKCDWFGKVLSRNRFQAILKFFHITNSTTLPPHGSPDYNPCGRFQPLIDHANRLFHHYYVPYQKLSVDESLVGTKKRVALTQYMPKKKHHRWGIKLWVLCDAITNYCLQFYCYKGAKYEDNREEIERVGQGYSVVKKLMEMGNFLNKGYHLYLDNFFTSKKLVRFLYENMTWLTGTYRIDRKGVPKKLLGKFPVGKRVYVRKGPLLFMAFREKASNKTQFILVSSNAKAKSVRYSLRRAGKLVVKCKPHIVYEYNHGMGGIDGTDQMLYTYLDERRCMKHFKKVIFNIFGRMVLNAYVLYKLNTDRPLSRLHFQISIIENLAHEWLLSKVPVADVRGGGDGFSPNRKFGVEKLEGTKESNCCVCSGKNNPEGKRRRSKTICINCRRGCHLDCLPRHKCK